MLKLSSYIHIQFLLSVTLTPQHHYNMKQLMKVKVVYNCLNYPQVNSVKTLTPLGIVFSHPEMAIVGQSYKQLKDEGIDFITGEASYERQGRAIVLGKIKVLLKFI